MLTNDSLESPMHAAGPAPHTPEELARAGSELFDRQVRPLHRPEDEGKFIAIAIDAGDHEIDADDFTAVKRLRARHPSAEIWLGSVGHPAAYRMRHVRCACN